MTKLERIVLTSSPFAFVQRTSKRISLPGFKGLPVHDVIVFLKQQIRRTGLARRAKAIAFDFAMAIPAVFICILTLIPYLPVAHQFERELLQLTRKIAPTPNAYSLVRTFLNDFLHNPRVGLTSFSFVLVIFYASNAMMSIIRTFDLAIYSQRVKGNFIKRRIKAIRLTVIVLLLFVGTILLSIGQGILFDYLMKWLKLKGSDVTWVSTLRWIITVALFYYSISFIYRYAPTVKKRWSLVTPGAFVATTLMLATTFIFSFWVNHFNNFNKIYGSLGTIMILMLLIYLNSLILLFGFEVNLSISLLKAKTDEEKKEMQRQRLSNHSQTK